MFAECTWALQHLHYRNFLFQRREEVILDNSSYVADEPIDADTHLDISRHIPNCMVIATDFLGDGERTRSATADFISRWHKLGVWKPRLMVVAQGDSYEDFVRTYQLFAKQEYVDAIGIPFRQMFGFEFMGMPGGVVEKDHPLGRIFMMNKMNADGVLVGKPFHHFLGMGTLMELQAGYYPPHFMRNCVFGADSSLIFKAARLMANNNIPISEIMTDEMIRKKIDKRFDLEERFDSKVFRAYKSIWNRIRETL
jgi:hypothetical protein